MEDVTLRRMRSGELAEVAAVWRRARYDANPGLEARLGHSTEEDLVHLSDVVIPRYEIWVAEYGGRIVGMMAKQGGDLDKLYVDPSLQRRGIGKLLLEKAKCDSPTGLELFTHQTNMRARAFYEANGFIATEFGVSPPPESEPDVKLVWVPRRPERDE
jgi:ribosomal protein S18 acetylase RimI-like enzyme